MVDREIAEIEAVMRKHLRLVIAMRAGVEHAAGIDGVRQAAMEIAALRSKDREDGARLTFSNALAEIKRGAAWRRAAWKPGKSVSLVAAEAPVLSHLALVYDDGRRAPWTPTRCDLLEEDWIAALPHSTEQTEAGDA